VFSSPLSVTAVEPRAVTPRGPLAPEEEATISLFEKSRGSVVYITTQARVIDPWTRNIFNIPRGTGSGFVWDDIGTIVTNFHVVAGASGARVRLSDGRDVAATLVGVSPAHDLAVIRVECNSRLQRFQSARATIFVWDSGRLPSATRSVWTGR
jgi:S1-C subfamily serine protease